MSEGLFDKVNIHRAFMGAAGFALEAGLTDATEEEAQIKRLFTTAATEVVGLVDHTKWERAAFATFCPTASLAAVVADAAAPEAMAEALRSRGIDVHLIEAAVAPSSAIGSAAARGTTPW